jgi:hypothetical protein
MRVALITVHGIGTQGPDFANDFEAAVRAEVLDQRPKLNDDLKFFPAFWQGAIQPEETADDLKISKLPWKRARSLMLSYAADALAYQPSSAHDCYARVNAQLDLALCAAAEWVGEDGVLVIVAHSLGTIVMSNFVWDAQNPGSDGNESYIPSEQAKQALTRIEGVFTLGCPLMVWSLRYDGGGIPISVPFWRNVFSPYDVIGYPIKQINSAYAALPGAQDVQLAVGPWWDRYTPISHIHYLDDSRVIQMVADKIVGLG